MGVARLTKLVIIFSIVGLIGYFGYKLGKGDFNIFNGLGNLVGFSSESKDPVNGLILGTDKDGTRTDFIMFVSYNPLNKKVTMVSIPRDTRVPNSIDKKINSLYIKQDTAPIIKDVSSMMGMPIKYYAVINFKGIRTLVDEIGGIPLDVPIDMKYYDPAQNLKIDLDKGYQVLDGEKAEEFVRFRKGYADADLGRIKAQHEFINAAIAQITKPQNIVKIPTLINIFKENVKTNMTIKEMLSYANDVSSITKDSISIETIPGEPKYIAGVSYFIYDSKKTQEMLDKLFLQQEETVTSQTIEKNKDVKVEIYNGTDIPGFGAKIADKLKTHGFNVIKTENYENSNVMTTKIYEKNRNVDGANVKSALGIGNVQSDYDESSQADIYVIVGQDLNR